MKISIMLSSVSELNNRRLLEIGGFELDGPCVEGYLMKDLLVQLLPKDLL